MGHHGYYCDGSLKGHSVPKAGAPFVLYMYMMWWKPSVPSHARTLWYGELLNAIAKAVGFLQHIYLKIRAKP
jgi:hypothetical protein